MTTASSRVRRGYVDAPTGQVHYRLAGPDDGIELVLLHQSPSSSLMYERAYPRFAERGVRVVGIDTPGFGQSDVPDPRPSIETYASVIPAVLDGLGFTKPAVLGHHTGGCTATEFAVTHPERVSKLILNGPALYTPEERQARLDAAHRHGLPLQPDGSHLLERWNRRLKATPGWTDLYAMNRNVLQTLIAGDTEWYGHLAAFEYQMMERFPLVTVPTLILANTGDDLYHQAQRARQVKPDAAYVELQGGTHDIVDEQPDAWCDAVVAYLRS
jgi:pimeloyl-ACP methyl ester carboxylesterase